MPQKNEEVVKKESQQQDFNQLDFVYAPVPEHQNLSLDSVSEYSKKREQLARDEVSAFEEQKSEPTTPFTREYVQEQKDELVRKLENGELPKRTLQRVVSATRLRFMGISNPSEFLAVCFDQPTSMFLEHHDRKTREDVIGYDYQRAVELAKDLVEITKQPAELLKRFSAIGFAFTMITHDQQSDPEFLSFVDRLLSMPENKFQAAAKSLQELTWLNVTHGFENHFQEEFSARMAYLDQFPDISAEDQAAIQAMSVLEGVCGPPIERLDQVMGHNEEIQALVVVAKELLVHRKEGREDSTSRFQDRERLRKIWIRTPVLLGLAKSLREGRRIDLEEPIFSRLNSYYLDDEQAEALEKQTSFSLTEQQQEIANLLDLHTVQTTELVVRIDTLVQKTLELQMSFDTREAVLSLLNSSDQDKSFYRIADVFDRQETSEILQEWIQAETDIENASEMRRSGDERNFLDALDRRLAFKRLLSRAMLIKEGENFDSELLHHVLRRANEVKMSGYLDKSTKARLPVVDRKIVHLIDQIDVATATNTLDFLLDNAEEIAAYVSEDFKVTEEFLVLFFESTYAAGSNSHNEVAKLLESSGVAAGLVEYLNSIQPILRLSGTPLSDHYKPIFLIFFNNESETDRNRKLLDYWKEKHSGVFIRSFSKDLLAEYFGEAKAQAFLAALPKRTDERRNAFLHNDYDRTSQWIIDMQNETSGYRHSGTYLEEVTFDFSNDIDIATAFVSRFGLAKNPFLFEVFKVLSIKAVDTDYELPQKVTELGLSSLEDLYREYDQVHEYLISTEPLLDVAQLTEFQKVLLSSVTGRDTHTFSRRDTMQDILDRFQLDLESGEVTQVPEAYVVEKVSFSDVEIAYEPSEIVQSKFNLILEIVGEIVEHPGKDHWQRVVEDFKVLLAEQVTLLKEKLEAVPEKQRTFIERQIEDLAETVENVTAITSIDEALQVIGSFNPDKQQSDAWEILVQRLVFSRILNEGPLQNKLQSLAAASELSPKALLTAINVYDELIKHHAINFESEESSPYWSLKTREFFADKRQKKQLKRLKGSFSTVVAALKEDISRFEKTVLESQRGIDMIPDKGLIGEMSGYVANACYTNEQSMLRNWDVTPYKFIDTNRDPAELVGTGLVFRVELESGEPALLVRAINIPNEEAYDMETFCEEFIEAVVRVGQKVGAKKVLIPGATGAMSNYQMTIGHLKATYCEGKTPVTLSDRFAFNGYDLTQNSYVAREL